MNNKNNQLIKKANAEITTNFQKRLEKPIAQLIQTKKYNSSWKDYIFYTPTPDYYRFQINGREFSYDIDQWVSQYSTNTREHEWNFAAINNFIALLEKEVKQQTFTILNHQLTNSESIFRKVITNMETEVHQEKNETERELQETKDKLAKLEEKLANYQKNKAGQKFLYDQTLVDYKQLQKTKQLLHSQFTTLEAEGESLRKSTKDLREQLLERESFILKLERLIIDHESFQKQLAQDFQTLEQNNQNLQEQLTETVDYYTLELLQKDTNLEAQQQKIANLQLSVEERRQDWLAESLANVNLTNQLNTLRNDLEEQIFQLTNNLTELENKYQKATLSLDFHQNQLTELQRLHFWEKIKLNSILTLDTARSFLPNSFNSAITGLETTILTARITNNHKIEKVSWILIFLFLLGSIIYTLYKLTKFTFFKGIDLFRWLKGKKTDFNTLKEQELQQWKDKWKIEKNYSQVELENVRKDEEVVNIEINDQFNTSDLKVSKLSKEKKKALK